MRGRRAEAHSRSGPLRTRGSGRRRALHVVPALTAWVRPDPGHPWRVVHLEGELGTGTVSGLAPSIASALRAGHRYLLLDLAEVTSCDVAGLNAVLDVRARLRDRDARLALRHAPGALRRMLQALQLEQELIRTPDPPGSR